jgi:hypothetical protein
VLLAHQLPQRPSSDFDGITLALRSRHEIHTSPSLGLTRARLPALPAGAQRLMTTAAKALELFRRSGRRSPRFDEAHAAAATEKRRVRRRPSLYHLPQRSSTLDPGDVALSLARKRSSEAAPTTCPQRTEGVAQTRRAAISLWARPPGRAPACRPQRGRAKLSPPFRHPRSRRRSLLQRLVCLCDSLVQKRECSCLGPCVPLG